MEKRAVVSVDNTKDIEKVLSTKEAQSRGKPSKDAVIKLDNDFTKRAADQAQNTLK